MAPAKVVLADVTSEPPLPSNDLNLVSWESAFWALLAVMVNTLLQNSGAVLSMPYTMRIGLRSSPLLSALDPIMVLVKFIALLAVGCSPRTAARHVWWDRFPIGSDREDSGTSGIWPYTVWAFLFGALPQFVKIWGMQGILPTQIVATIYFASFIFMEMLRLAAGTVGTEDLMPMPIVCITKRFVDRTTIGLAGMLECQQMFIWGSVIPYMLWPRHSEDQMKTFVLTSSFPSLFLVPMFMGKTIAYVRALDSVVESAEADATPLLEDLDEYGEAMEMYALPPTKHPSKGSGRKESVAKIQLQVVAKPSRDEEDPVPYAFRSSTVLISEVKPLHRPNLGNAFLILFLPYTYVCWLVYQFACLSDFAVASSRRGGLDEAVQGVFEFAFMLSIMFAAGCVYALLVLLRRVPLIKPVLAVIGIRGESLLSRLHELNAFVLLALNLVTVFTYYTCVYIAAGTRKPRWTEILG